MEQSICTDHKKEGVLGDDEPGGSEWRQKNYRNLERVVGIEL
jgi:hypothetical protein